MTEAEAIEHTNDEEFYDPFAYDHQTVCEIAQVLARGIEQRDKALAEMRNQPGTIGTLIDAAIGGEG